MIISVYPIIVLTGEVRGYFKGPITSKRMGNKGCVSSPS